MFSKISGTSRTIILVIVLSLFSSFAFSQDIDPSLYSSLKYRYIGPEGNRVIAVVGVPGDPNTAYFGAASGGIFKTIDGGVHWNPIFDKQDVSSVSALAIAPSDKNVIWAGTGETFIRSNISVGNGIYKSTDGGKTWKNMGLELTGRIGRIIIDPRNPDVVFAAALGNCYGPQQERGVYRTKDGGLSWERVLFVDENTGCSDIAMDFNNPRILIAGMWQIEMKTWVRTSGGPGSGLHMSRDGGNTWEKLSGKGLPKSPVGKIGVAFAPNNSEKIYALIETDQFDFSGVLWRSDNGGESWKLISHDQEYNQRPSYYQRLTVAPDDENEVYFMAHGVWRSYDGGKTAESLRGAGGDDHDMWIDPLDPDRIIVGNDGGVALSVNRGKTWHRPPLPIAQMYHVDVDDRIPYNVYGNRQDGPSTMGPSNNLAGRNIPVGFWHSIGGFECGHGVVDDVDNNIVWAGGYDGLLTRYDQRTGHARTVTVWPDEPMGWGPAPLKYRWNWTFPILISPFDHNTVYVGSQFVHKTTDGGETWTDISPDLTTNDKSRQLTSGGLTIDNIGVDFGCTLFALAESPLEQGVIWAGSNDGLMHITMDGGTTWDNVTDNIPDLPEWGTVSNIEPSRFNAGTCYITVDFHQMNNRDPYVYKTENYGKSWKKITDGIPKSMLSYAHCVKEDPKRPGMLYLGTENSVYVTFDDGEKWFPLQNNLPHAPAHWLVVQERFSDLVIGTYGRGFWIMDDISPLRELDKKVLESDAFLFKLRPAYRFQEIHGYMSANTDADGQNPPYGASINFYFKEAPEDTAYISIMDKNGDVIRELSIKKGKGIKRVTWDLRYERATEPELRTPPLGYPGAYAGPERLRYGAKGWRRLVTWGYGGFAGPRVSPGTYIVKLTVGENQYTEELEVLKDPNTDSSEEDIRAQVSLALEIRNHISEVAEMVTGLEWIRKQIDDLHPLLKKLEDNKPLLDALKELDKKCIDVEQNFFQLTLTGTFADDLRGPTMHYSKLMSLANGVQNGDFKPTSQQYKVHQLHSDNLAGYRNMYEDIVNIELPAFNSLLRERNMFSIIPAGK